MSDVESKSGYVERKTPSSKKGKGKFMWISVYGSSLFCYTETISTAPRETYEIKDATIVAKPLTIEVQKDSKMQISITCTSKEEFESWKAALEEAVTKEAGVVPQKEKVKKDKGSAAMRVGKTVGGKFTASGIGKSAVKGVVHEEIRHLIVALKRMIARIESQKKAEEVESNIMKIVTKAYFLEKDKKVTTEQFLSADAPLRRAFELLVEMRDFRHRMRPDTVKERLATVHNNLLEVERILTVTLSNFISPNSIKRIATTFGLLASEEFLDRAWSDADLEEERDLLSDAMNKYTQFNF